MFKKTAIAASIIAVTTTATVVSAEEAEPKYGHDFYGIIAVQVAHRDYDNAVANNGAQINNETRLGWRGYAKFDQLPEHTKFIWQVETGYVDASFGGLGKGYLGERDTFVGFESTVFGKVRAGRVLTPLYELVDWPASNPGLGDVWDWGGTIGGNKHNDRQSDTIRFDSNELWTGFTFDLAVGAGNDRAGSTDSINADQNYWHGAAAHQKFDYDNGWFQLDFAYEMNYKTQEKITNDNGDVTDTNFWNNQAYLIGVQGGHGFFGYFAQYRLAKAKNTSDNIKEEQQSNSVGLMYNFGENNRWQAKVGYAKNYDLKVGGTTQNNTADDVWSTQLMYSIDSNAVVYARYRQVDAGETYLNRGKTDSFKEASVGIEYWF